MKSKIIFVVCLLLFIKTGMANVFNEPRGKLIASSKNTVNVNSSESVPTDENDENTDANNVTLSGYISDKNNGEVLIGATVLVKELGVGTVTNAYGYYSIVVEKGSYTFEYSYIGYKSSQYPVDLQKSQKMNVELSDASEKLQEVVVTGEKKNSNVERVQMSTVKLPVKMIKKLPSFMGEVDILRSIQLMPGIQGGGEASSGLYVRGGGPDENLLVLDEAPVYNASHLLGFFSVFNSDAIKDIEVYKGGIPANYGGKASSVIDIRMKDGNNKEWHTSGGIGNLSVKSTIEGPIIKDKWSLIISGRLMYGALLAKNAGIQQMEGTDLYFYDLNAKSNIILSDKDKVFMSFYTGRDIFEFEDAIYMNWGNQTATARWNHIFGDRWFSNTSLIYSKYNYSLGVPGDGPEQFDWSSKIRDVNFKEDVTWFANSNNKVALGLNAIHHHFEPGKITANEGSFYNDTALTHFNALDNDFYITNEQKIGNLITLQYGLRVSVFQQMGKGKVRHYENPDNLQRDDTAIRVDEYAAGELIGSPFINLQPRFSIKYTLDENSSIKASYNRMVQNLHMISNTNSPTPLDIWLPSNKYIKPLIADQVALGYFRNFMDNTIETSVEAYYKNMQNVVDYVDGAELFLNESLETQLLEGKGYSYGLEMLIKKQQGRFTGWTAYTLSRTMREIPGINGGKAYPSSYDRTHDVSIVLSYALNKYWDISANWLYSTGNPTSYPLGKYPGPNVALNPEHGNVDMNFEYAERNSYRIPSYHRLDLSANFNFKKNEHRKYKQTLNFSFFNVYARRNAYSIYFRQNEVNSNISEAVRMSIVGTIIPSITYSFKY